MKSDLDGLMQERELDAIVVVAGHDFSAALDYLVGSVRITGGLAVKKTGEAPVLVVNSMELEEAQASGLQVYTSAEMKMIDFYKAAEGDTRKAQVDYWAHVLASLGIEGGRVGVYGSGELNAIIEIVRGMQADYPQYELVGETGATLFDRAALTKDADELTRIKSVAARTSEVLQLTWDMLAACRIADGQITNGKNQPVTIGDVKRFIRRALLDRDLEDTGMIFALGRDAGFPHSRGNESEVLRPGESIVFDLFPRELGGGYHHDVTRTWCLGYAPEAVQDAYNQVMEAYDISMEAYGLGKGTHHMQNAVCDYFEAKGHKTARSEPGTIEGYVHSLGHGIGLNIHEGPRITHMSEKDTFEVGNVVTIEPGLYYPERGFGVRYEDALYVDDKGELVTLTDFRPDLVLPLEG